MKLGPVTKLDKRNKITSKKNDDDVTLTNFDVIVIFPTYSQFGAIRKPDSLTFINSSFLSYKNWEQN